MQYLIVILLALIVLLYVVNLFEKSLLKFEERAWNLMTKTMRNPIYIISAVLIATLLLLSGYREDILMKFGTAKSASVYSVNYTNTPVGKSGYCDRLVVRYKINDEDSGVVNGTDNLDGYFTGNSKLLPKVGGEVLVWYLRAFPAYNSVVKPVDFTNNDRLVQIIVGTFIILSLLGILLLRNKKLKENGVMYTVYSVSSLVSMFTMLYGIADILCWFIL